MSASSPAVSPSEQALDTLHQAVHDFREGTPVPPVQGADYDVAFTVTYLPNVNLLSGRAEVTVGSGNPVTHAVYVALSNAVAPAPSKPYCEAIMTANPAIGMPASLLAYSNELPPIGNNTTIYGVAIIVYSFGSGGQQTGLVSTPITISGTTDIDKQMVLACGCLPAGNASASTG